MKRLLTIIGQGILICSLGSIVPLRAIALPLELSKTTSNGRSISACRALVWEKSVDSDDKDFMHGTSELTVMVPNEHPYLSDIDFEPIRAAVEAKCRKAGLKIANGHNHRTPLLSINLDCIGTGPGSQQPRDKQLAWIVDLELYEISILSHDMKTRSLSRLYAYRRLKCVGELKTSQSEIEKDFLDSVDFFITQWKAAKKR